MELLENTPTPISIDSTLLHDIDPNRVEAVKFAWLAHRHLAGEPGNIPGITGIRRAEIPAGPFVPDLI